MTVTALGIDLAKISFALHGIDQQGSVLIKKNVRRANLAKVISKLAPCLIGMEACSGAHYWARLFTEMGHCVKLMPPQFVKPYVKFNKNDAADAEAICEAVTVHLELLVLSHELCNLVNCSKISRYSFI